MNDENLIELTAKVVGAYVSSNPVPTADLPDLIASVSLALHALSTPPVPPEPALVPAVNPKKSVFPDYIVSLEDGSRYKSLKRHLRVKYDLTPAEYRAKWGLASDYPMTAPNYAATRSALAKALGLGRKPAPRVPEKAPLRGRAKRAKQT